MLEMDEDMFESDNQQSIIGSQMLLLLEIDPWFELLHCDKDCDNEGIEEMGIGSEQFIGDLEIKQCSVGDLSLSVEAMKLGVQKYGELKSGISLEMLESND
ncbi:MAG: hypothetical protein EZS28_012560 [Streblomastix strix]|uniref:Uncharacterized protein n=1 Tax=Streblomastix strix TaxID=222440 RepID=A0A5J4WAI2_9EUKA|nr:MAG: hypothetical protein EZS28_012560 [Streblomastix strix]